MSEQHDKILPAYLEAADAWLCDGYALDIRYLADTLSGEARIWDASIHLNPLPPERNLGFRIESSGICIGQIQFNSKSKSSLLELLKQASTGDIQLATCSLGLTNDGSLSYHSEMSYRDRWFSPLHLQVTAPPRPPPSPIELYRIDNILRKAQPPFDGLLDAAAWLGLNAAGASSISPTITIRVSPPVELIIERCQLAKDTLTLTLHAHPKFDVNRVGLAIRVIPGDGLDARKQVADSIVWKSVRKGRREGIAKIHVSRADQALAILLIGDSTVRRQWILDSTKARNHRFLAVQHFDNDLRMIRHSLLENPDPSKFEHAVAALLFLLGFTPAVQLETNAPDIVVTTPQGRLAIVECTTRVADFPAKLGKLVDRRGGLGKALTASGHPAEVTAVLVCRLPRDQIAAQAAELQAHRVLLVTGEDLAAGIDAARFPGDPDKLLSISLSRVVANPPQTV